MPNINVNFSPGCSLSIGVSPVAEKTKTMDRLGESRGEPPLHLAVRRADKELARTLLQDCGGEVWAVNSGGESALHVVTQPGMVAMLVAAGASCHQEDGQGNTPLLSICSAGVGEEEAVTVVKELLAVGADVNAANKNLQRPLEVAINHNCFEIATTLLSNKADVNTVNIYKESPLIIAAQKENARFLHSLLQLGADIQHRDARGDQPIHWAAKKGHHKNVEILLQHNRELIDKQNDSDETILLLGCKQGDLKIVETALRKDAGVDIPDNNGDTPLFWASKLGHHQIVHRLLKKGADLNVINNEKLSPLKIAAVFKHRDVYEILKEHRDKITNKEDILFSAWKFDDLDVGEEVARKGFDVMVMVKYFSKDPVEISSLMSFIAKFRKYSKNKTRMLEFHQIPCRNFGNISLYEFIINQGQRYLRQREELIDHLNNIKQEKEKMKKPKTFKKLIIEDLKKNVPTSEGLASSILAVQEKFPWNNGKRIFCILFSFIRKAFILKNLNRLRVGF